jgi:hypothetical protein
VDTIDLTNPQTLSRLTELAAHAEQNIVRIFLEKHPELLQAGGADDVRNREVIEGIINQNGWPLRPEALEQAYNVALENRMLTLPMYSSAEEQVFPLMSTAQMKDYLQTRYQTPRPPNAAEFLPTEGERRWKSDTTAMSEEQLAVLREKLLRMR